MARWGEGQEGANKAGRKGAFGGRMQALQCLDKMLARRKTQVTLVPKASYWRWPDRDMAGNAIDFYVKVLGASFHDAMKELSGG